MSGWSSLSLGGLVLWTLASVAKVDSLWRTSEYYPEQVRFCAVATQPAPEAASEEMRLAGMLILRPSPPGVKAESCSRR
jgi:hypothetical protein